ncbi:MAG: Gfo/Idh/MocA family oxidoreductase [Pirellulaceae bacterium]|nr:Gfo/Idh/MocA family oxidoreductase [Pirellulaceae bacterium]
MSQLEGKLGVAIHGVGDVAYAHAASWRKNPHVEIVSVSSRNPESARQLVDRLQLTCPVRPTMEEVLRDERVQIVNLSGPNHVHAEQAIAAAEAGRHVLVEKPMALTLAECRAVRDAIARHGVKSIVGFVLRWNPLLESLKSLVSQNGLGQLFYAEVDYWHGLTPAYRGWEWASRIATGGSAMLFGGCHAVDALRWLAGDEVAEVAAFGHNPHGLYEYPPNVVAAVKFRNGMVGKTSVLLDAKIPYTFNIDLLGTEGAARDNRLWLPRLLPGQRQWTAFPTIGPDSGDVHHHPFDAQINHFVECIRQDVESHCNVADTFHTHELCLAIDQSLAAGGTVVRLPLENA